MKLAEFLEQNELKNSIKEEMFNITQSIENAYRFNGTLSVMHELNILTMLVRNPIFAEEYLLSTKPEHFTQVHHKTMINVLHDVLKKTASFQFNYSILANELLALEDELSIGDKLVFNSVMNTIYSGETAQISMLSNTSKEYKYSVNILNAQKRTEELKGLIYENVVKLQNDFVATEDINQLIKKLMKVQEIGNTDNKTHCFSMDNLENAYEQMVMQAKSAIECNITELQQTTSGIERGSLVVPVAQAGVGKSMFLTDWTAKQTKKNNNVLYITLELSEIKIYERIIANWLNKPIADIKKLGKKEFIKLLNQYKKSNKVGELFIYRFNPNQFTVEQLRKNIDNLSMEYELKHGFPLEFDLICVDYLGLMKPSTKCENSYEELKSISEDLRSVAVDYDCIVCSPAQATRKKDGSNGITLNDIAGSMGIAHTADVVISLDNTPNSVNINGVENLKMNIIKNRFGECKSNITVTVNKNTMRFGANIDDNSSK